MCDPPGATDKYFRSYREKEICGPDSYPPKLINFNKIRYGFSENFNKKDCAVSEKRRFEIPLFFCALKLIYRLLTIFMLCLRLPATPVQNFSTIR